jgi:nucleoside-diphosphate-sugar epimerase
VIDGPGVDAYGKSKILAERAAWDFIKEQGGTTELTTILPVAVLGPVLGKDVSVANHIVQRSLNGEMPGYPNMYIPIVDVRDVAAAHLAAMTAPTAAGQRIIVASDRPAMAMKQIGQILKDNFGDAAKKAPSRGIPDFVVRLAARFKPEFRRWPPTWASSRRSPTSGPTTCWASPPALPRKPSSTRPEA